MIEESLIWFVSGGLLFTTVILIVACICGCHKSVPKSSAGATLSSATRSLPDLPVETPRGSDAVATAVWYGGDTNSELYATVEENKKGVKEDASKYTSNTMSPSSGETASKSECVYACVKKENPYDKLLQEHPYAKVGVNSLNNQSSSSQRLDKVSSTESIEMDVVDRGIPDQDIAAASVIAGDESASVNIPYMTPPVDATENPLNEQIRQGHYSGDSHDSNKGYTSISVREPLSRIMANVQSNGGVSTDPHYAFVSDDSDEMYAAIIDPTNNVYTSGSETYAQIPSVNNAPVASTSNNNVFNPSTSHSNGSELIQTHSRKDSSSSAVSGNSPKPEKRPANSPLPKPPEHLDEMYAKVMKKRNDSPEQSPPAPPPPIYDNGIYDRLMEPNVPQLPDIDPNYEELRPTNHGYARIKKVERQSEPDYASLTRTITAEYVENDPNYESLKMDLNEINHNSIYSEVNKR
ncbi:protein spalten isoform X2 [Adelges cooleyi]|uniref:protein spalten isoform X2 n=1 Tax=Adelges cooleyi TaxID=133065 RepID=UPI00218005AC|nr:protein spalten isoform X2 [Adelges cooleyi]